MIGNASRACTVIVVLVVTEGLGCSGTDDEVIANPSSPPAIEGGICNTSLSACRDDSHILKCQDRRWASVACSDFCSAGGRLALGCNQTKVDANCICGDRTGAPVPECLAGDTRCAGVDTMASCSDGAWVLESCADHCARGDSGYSSAGCGYTPRASCLCTVEGSACSALRPYCAGPRHLARCEGGVVVLQDCTTQCALSLKAYCTDLGTVDAGGTCDCAS
jgi:hypothetical protein